MTPHAPVTDAHLHLWDLDASPYAWLAGAPDTLCRTFGFAQVRPGLEALGVTRVILVQADDTAADTEHLKRTARAIEAGPGSITRADVVGWLPLMDPDAVQAALADPDRMRHIVGIRHLIHDEPDPGFLERPEVGRSLELLAAAGLPLDVPDAYPRHMEQVVRLASQHPRLVIVLDHLGKPPFGDEPAMSAWREQLERIAMLPNVVAKLSGLATSGTGEFADAADTALELFGADRLMIGSDWPIAPRTGDLGSGFAPLLTHVRSWDAGVVQAVTHGTAETVYRRIR